MKNNMEDKKKMHKFEFHVGDNVREVFVGHHTLFSVLGFTVGGILIGGSIEKILHDMVGRPLTLLIGMVLLLVSGVVLHRFNDNENDSNPNAPLE